ncbi:MAG: HAMP domain-containing sensor histidine kinase [Thermoleophilia bacterium]
MGVGLILGLGTFLTVRLTADLTAGVDAALAARASQLVSTLSDNPGAGANLADGSDVTLPGLAPRESLTQVLAPGGSVTESAGSIDAEHGLLTPPQLARAHVTSIRLTRTLPNMGRTRLLALPTGRGGVVVVGTALRGVDEARTRLHDLLLVGGAIALILCGGASWLLAGRALRPIDRLSRAAAGIGADELDRRVPVPETGDEAARLAITVNRLLDRVGEGVGRQRAFVADASHELRTPLAVLRAELEVALRSSTVDDATRSMLLSLDDEAARLSRLLEDLLTLARADAGGLELRRCPGDLAEPAARSAALLTSLAARKGVVITTLLDSAPAEIDEDRITQVALNIIDNAIRHTPAGRHVDVQTGEHDGISYLAVRDEGPGIPLGLAGSIFERFSRGDPARARGSTGLGLAIARTIALEHGGTLTLDAHGSSGSLFVLRLPRRSDPIEAHGDAAAESLTDAGAG